jgi:peptidoglycan/LPS O-acetylase OafA/YrhL
VLVAVSTRRFGEGQVLGASGWATVLAAGCTLILALTVMGSAEGRPVGRLGRLLDSRVLVGAGLVSYSIFLWNEPVARWLSNHGVTFGGRTGFLANLLLIGAATAILATITYVVVEAPALRRKSRGPATREPKTVHAAVRADATAP